jgi:hypothetical protein
MLQANSSNYLEYVMAPNSGDSCIQQNLWPSHILNNWKNLEAAQIFKVSINNKFDHKLNICTWKAL